jgi:hypothetical protein
VGDVVLLETHLWDLSAVRGNPKFDRLLLADFQPSGTSISVPSSRRLDRHSLAVCLTLT